MLVSAISNWAVFVSLDPCPCCLGTCTWRHRYIKHITNLALAWLPIRSFCCRITWWWLCTVLGNCWHRSQLLLRSFWLLRCYIVHIRISSPWWWRSCGHLSSTKTKCDLSVNFFVTYIHVILQWNKVERVFVFISNNKLLSRERCYTKLGWYRNFQESFLARVKPNLDKNINFLFVGRENNCWCNIKTL